MSSDPAGGVGCANVRQCRSRHQVALPRTTTGRGRVWSSSER